MIKEFSGILLAAVLIISIMIYSMVCIANIIDTNSLLEKVNAIEYTIVTSEIAPIESVVKFNKLLADYKYYNKTFLFGWTINNSVDNLQFIDVNNLKEGKPSYFK